MKNTLLEVSRKIDQYRINVYELLSQIAEEQKILYFVVGASARDLILHYVYNKPLRRATLDIDIAIQVSSWQKFYHLKNKLILDGGFQSSNAIQRIFHREYQIPIDIIPFGKIESAEFEIQWPPDFEISLNLMGFNDALKNIQMVRLQNQPDIIVPVASIPSQVVLKLIAWKDRHFVSNKDAIDLSFLLKNYINFDNQNEILTGRHSDLLDDFDYENSGARLLGRHIAERFSINTINYIVNLLDNEIRIQNRHVLLEDMLKSNQTEDFNRNLFLLSA